MPSMLDTVLQLVRLSESGSASSITQLMSASTTKVAWVFQAETADPITDVFFSASAKAGTVPTYTAGLQGLTSTGTPDGTYKGGGSPASATTAPAATGGQVVTLANAYAPARGDRLALVVEYSSGAIDAGDNITVRTGVNSDFNVGFPYLLVNTGSWAKQISTGAVFWGYRAGGRWYGKPATDATTNVLANVSGNKVAVKFTLPAGAGEYFTVKGLRIRNRPVVSTSAAYKFGLWDAAGNTIQSAALDSDETVAMTQGHNYEFLFADAALRPLRFGVPYYVGFDGLGNAQPSMDCFTFDSAALLAAMGLRGDVVVSSYAGGAWTDALQLPLAAGLILGDWRTYRRLRGGRVGDIR